MTPPNKDSLRCGANERLNECGPVDYCEKSCQNPYLDNVDCPDTCITKCVCISGYRRDSKRNCIPKAECSSEPGLIMFITRKRFYFCYKL